jgi:class 3 adenylate cyclase
VPIQKEAGVILAVDDMPENRELISRLLSRAGHTVISAESGEEALELLETRGVDVVLLDLMMPGIGGAEVLKKMKEHEGLRATPVIMISGRQDMDQIITCIQAGADDYLLKPFNPVLLQARISAGIERKRWHDREEDYRHQLERNERFIRRTFGRYLSDDIVEQLLEAPEGLELGGDLREVTIMMSDICGFTILAEHLPPTQVVSLLNRYFEAMTAIIFEAEGTIDEFLGDAILAVFGAPRRLDDDPERAVRCALAMREAMEAVNAANALADLPALSQRIALNTGTVIAGNIGSEQRAKYGCVGHAMNVTSRIEGQAAVNEILIAEATRQLLPDGVFRFGEPREIFAKGIEDSILTYPVLGLR